MHEGCLWGSIQDHAHGRQVFYHWAIFHYFTVKNSIPIQVLFAKVGKHHLVLLEVGICISDFSVAVVKHGGQCDLWRRNFSLVMVPEDTSLSWWEAHHKWWAPWQEQRTESSHFQIWTQSRENDREEWQSHELKVQPQGQTFSSKSVPRKSLQAALLAEAQVSKCLSIFLFFSPRNKDLGWYCVILPLGIQIPEFILFFSHILLREVNSLMLHILTKIFKVASHLKTFLLYKLDYR